MQNIWSKIQRRAWLLRKEISHQFASQPDMVRVLFIVGCQRSGTSLMLRIFENDKNAAVYGELDPRVHVPTPGNHRMRPIPVIRDRFLNARYPLIVTKPLVESQNILTLLDAFPGSKAIWMYRSYVDVAASNLKAFGDDNGTSDLRPIIMRQQENWRAEGVPDDLRELIAPYFHDEMNQYDAAALFWYVRNHIFFRLNLTNHPDVALVQYRDFVTSPGDIMRNVYHLIGQPYPGAELTQHVHRSSLNKGKDIPFSNEIRQLCEGMMQQFNEVNQLSRIHSTELV